MKVIAFNFNDVDDPENWHPEDVFDFEEWIAVTVGEEQAGTDFQVHVCTPVSIARLESKRNVFMIDRWEGIPSLIEQLNGFITDLERESTTVIEHELAKHWLWEYGEV